MAQRIYVLADTVWRIIRIIFLDMNEPSGDLIFYKLIVLRFLMLIGWLGWLFEKGTQAMSAITKSMLIQAALYTKPNRICIRFEVTFQ